MGSRRFDLIKAHINGIIAHIKEKKKDTSYQKKPFFLQVGQEKK